MDEQTVIEVVATKTPLARKVLILTGATVGLILAGGFAYLKTTSSDKDVWGDKPYEEATPTA